MVTEPKNPLSPPERPPHDASAPQPTPPDSGAGNDRILRRAYQILHKHFFRLFLLGALLFALTIVPVIVQMVLPQNEPLVAVVWDIADSSEQIFKHARSEAMRDAINTGTKAARAIVLWPLTGAGMALVMMCFWAGERPPLRDLFAYVRPRNGLFRAWGLGLFLQIANLAWIPVLLVCAGALMEGSFWTISSETISYVEYHRLIAANHPLETIGRIVDVITSAVAIWFAFRLTLVPYLLVKYPTMGVWRIIVASWRRMNGYCVRAFFLQLRTFWLPLVLMVIFFGVSYAIGSASAGFWVTLALFSLSTCIFTPLMGLAMAGLASEILDWPPATDAHHDETQL